MPGRYNVQVWTALLDRSMVGVSKDPVSPVCKPVKQRKTNQSVAVRLMICQEFGCPMDENRQLP